MMPEDQRLTIASEVQVDEFEQPTERRPRITINKRVLGSIKNLEEWQKQLTPTVEIPRSPLSVEPPAQLPTIVETPLPPILQNGNTLSETPDLCQSSTKSNLSELPILSGHLNSGTNNTNTPLETPDQYLSSISDLPPLPGQLNFGMYQKLIHYLIFPLKLLLRCWRFSRILFIFALLTLLLSGGLFEYVHLNSHEYGFFQVDAATGDIQWQQILNSPTQPLLVDGQGSIVATITSNHLHQLLALDRNGKVRWTSFRSKEIFAIPFTSLPGTVLVTLSEPVSSTPSLNSQLTLYLLNRGTGRIIWQHIVIGPNQHEYAQVLGTDNKGIYVASRVNNLTPLNVEATAQLTAIDLATGKKVWQVLTLLNTNAYNISTDVGKLLLQKQQLIWQVAGTLYAIATSDGTISWHRFIGDTFPAALPQIEDSMAETAGMLLVERSYSFHALDVTSGLERWNISNPNMGMPEASTGVLTSGHFFLVYNDGLLEAIDAINKQVIWSQKQFGTIQSLRLSDDGSKVYVVTMNSTDTTAPIQVLVAIETKTGTVLWTFEPFDQASYVHLQSDGFQYFNGTLFVSICLPDSSSSCARERLYAVNGNTGAALWKVEANSIYDVHIGSDGRTILFSANTSEWINFIGRFRT